VISVPPILVAGLSQNLLPAARRDRELALQIGEPRVGFLGRRLEEEQREVERHLGTAQAPPSLGVVERERRAAPARAVDRQCHVLSIAM
jgi:hypothetical protein